MIIVKSDFKYVFSDKKKYKYDKYDLMLLIPYVNNGADILIPIMCSKYLDFDKVKVKYQLGLVHIDFEERENSDYQTFEVKSLEFTDIEKFINFMHTVSRFSFCNNFVSDIFTNNLSMYPEEKWILFNMLDIEIYKKKELIYSKRYDFDKTVMEDRVICENIPLIANDTLEDTFSKLYKYPDLIFSNRKFVRFNKTEFQIRSRYSKGRLNGIVSDDSRSIILLTDDMSEALDNIVDLNVYLIFFFKEELSEEIINDIYNCNPTAFEYDSNFMSNFIEIKNILNIIEVISYANILLAHVDACFNMSSNNGKSVYDDIILPILTLNIAHSKGKDRLTIDGVKEFMFSPRLCDCSLPTILGVIK